MKVQDQSAYNEFKHDYTHVQYDFIKLKYLLKSIYKEEVKTFSYADYVLLNIIYNNINTTVTSQNFELCYNIQYDFSYTANSSQKKSSAEIKNAKAA